MTAHQMGMVVERASGMPGIKGQHEISMTMSG